MNFLSFPLPCPPDLFFLLPYYVSVIVTLLLHFFALDGSDAGIMKTLTDLTREYVRSQVEGGVDGNLAELSERYVTAAKELGLRSTPNIFALKHGRVSGMHFRTMAEVMEVIFLEYKESHPGLVEAIRATVRWYWESHAPQVSAESLELLRALGYQMRAAWGAVFEDPEIAPGLVRDDSDIPKGSFDELPKMHRAVAHLPDFLRLYGPYGGLTTEVSEAANKPLKMCFRT